MKKAFLIAALMIVSSIAFAGECIVWLTTHEAKMYKKDKIESTVIRTLPAWTALRAYDGLLGVNCSGTGRKNDWIKVQFPSIWSQGGGYDRGWVRAEDVVSANCPTKVVYDMPVDAFEADTLNACIMKFRAEKSISRLQTGFSFRIVDSPDSASGIVRDSYTIDFDLAGAGIGLKIDNKTVAPMKVIWDQSVIITSGGESLPVIHQGIKLIDSDKPQSPSMIAPGAHIKDIIAPKSGVAWTDAGWIAGPLFSDSEDPVGKRIGVMLALEVGGTVQYASAKLEVIKAAR